MNSNTLQGLSPVLYVWKDRLLFIGKIPENIPHGIPPATFSTNLCRPFSVAEKSDLTSRFTCRSVLWFPDQIHQSWYHPDDYMAFLMIEPYHPDWLTLTGYMQFQSVGGYYYDYKYQEEIVGVFTTILRDRPSLDEVYKMQAMAIRSQHDGDSTRAVKDERIVQTLNFIQQNARVPLPVAKLAEKVNLSPSRLTHLFKEQMHLSLSRYRLWLKMRRFLYLIATDQHMAEVAILSEFSDMAHFSNTFRKLFGVQPSLTLGRPIATNAGRAESL